MSTKTKITDKAKALNQWTKFIKNPTHGRFTQFLYEYFMSNGEFIAHLDKDGFIRARFWYLHDFDMTLKKMKQSKILNELLEATDSDTLGNARFDVASMEAHNLSQGIKVAQDHVIRLQERFTKELL